MNDVVEFDIQPWDLEAFYYACLARNRVARREARFTRIVAVLSAIGLVVFLVVPPEIDREVIVFLLSPGSGYLVRTRSSPDRNRKARSKNLFLIVQRRTSTRGLGLRSGHAERRAEAGDGP